MKAKIVLGRNWVTSASIERYANTQKLSHALVYVTDSQELARIVEDFGALGKNHDLDSITGAFVIVDNGDYAHIWITWDSAPYLTSADYQHVKLVLY